MAEVTRTHANHFGDIWVRFLEDDLVIMIDAKNASEHAVLDQSYSCCHQRTPAASLRPPEKKRSTNIRMKAARMGYTQCTENARMGT